MRRQAGLGISIGISVPRILQGQIGTGGGTPAEPGVAPTMQFNAAANSQLLAVLEDF